MSHYTLEDLITRWKREELTVEQMIGQFALVLTAQEQRLRALERRMPEEREEARTKTQELRPKN